MAVGFKVDPFWFVVGHGEFLHSFFSTISYHLEKKNWGCRFPYLMNNLYYDKLDYSDVPKALEEIEIIRKELENYKPSEIIWDIEDLNKRPPWGDNISAHITSLSNYFVTSDGRDLFEVLNLAFQKALKLKENVEIESL